MTSRDRRRKDFVKALQAHRATIEQRLNQGVDKPSCGCWAKWQWIWASADWILPKRFTLMAKACERHNTDQFYEEYHRLLNERMATVRSENKVPQ